MDEVLINITETPENVTIKVEEKGIKGDTGDAGPDHFVGKYTSLANLQAAHPTATDGDYGIVDAGSGSNAILYIWDANEGWVVIQGGGGGSQIQSDWNQADNQQVDFIKNKPTIPAAQIQSDWNQSNNASLDYIKNKPTIPVTDNNYTNADKANANGFQIEMALSDNISSITTGSKGYYTFKFACTVTNIVLTIGTAPTGQVMTLDIKRRTPNTSIFSTKLTIDAGERDSRDALTPYVLVTSPLTFADKEEIEVLIDQVGSIIAGKNAILTLIGSK